MYDESAEISVLVVNECCEKWFPEIKVAHCYRISRLTPRTANDQFNKTTHMYELQMTKVSLLVSCRLLSNTEATIDSSSYKMISDFPDIIRKRNRGSKDSPDRDANDEHRGPPLR